MQRINKEIKQMDIIKYGEYIQNIYNWIRIQSKEKQKFWINELDKAIKQCNISNNLTSLDILYKKIYN